MGHHHQCPVKTWRMLWILGLILAAIITFQYFELTNDIFLSSSYSLRNVVRNVSLLSDDVPVEPAVMINMSPFNVLNTSYGSLRTDNNDDKEVDANNDLVSEEMAGFRNSSDVDYYRTQASPEELVDSNVTYTANSVNFSDSGIVPTETMHAPEKNNRPNIVSVLNPVKSSDFRPADNSSILLASPSVDLSPNIILPRNADSIIITPLATVDSNVSATERDKTLTSYNNGKSRELQKNLTTLHDDLSVTNVPIVQKKSRVTTPAIVSISQMNNLLFQSLSSPNTMRPRWPSAVDQELLYARAQIENSPIITDDLILYPPLYQNISMFKRSYELMEDMLKVYIYREGKRPILHQPVLKGIYASEGWFMKLMEANKKFVTKSPRKAHIFYLPFSSRNLEEKLYVPNSHNREILVQYLKDYLDTVSTKYPFWNRTEGSDHFIVACHDWAPAETRRLMANCIRALCNSDVNEGFVFGKDVSLPETLVRIPHNPLRYLGGKPPSKRPILAFFAGGMHGYLRPIILKHWQNKDPDMKIFGYMPNVRGKMNYIQHMKSSKYCICAKGYEVNSPRLVEAIMYECVPVIISDNYVPPFLEVLNWESFAVFVPEKDIPNLKNILLSIPKKRYESMQMGVKRVQQHFLWHPRPVKYDLFHMILHSIWYNRVFRV